MYKEFFISIIIIVVIFSFDYVLQKYTNDSITQISDKLSKLKNQIRENELDSNQIEKQTDELYSKWMEYHEKLVFYIEHDELEKVETNFVAGKSYIHSKEYGAAIAELEKTAFVLDHIKDKYSFNLENLF